MNVEQKLEKSMYGPPKVKPDEQKKYLGTFRERVVIAVANQYATQQKYQTIFKAKLTEDNQVFKSLTMKINDSIDIRVKIKYMKIAKALNIKSTVVSENISNNANAYAIVVHSDQAENIEVIDIEKLNIDISKNNTPKKKNFFGKLFGSQK